jgi:hypothetical protein
VRAISICPDCLRKPFSQDIMTFRSLLGDDRFRGTPESPCITTGASLYKRYKEVTSRHGNLLRRSFATFQWQPQATSYSAKEGHPYNPVLDRFD